MKEEYIASKVIWYPYTQCIGSQWPCRLEGGPLSMYTAMYKLAITGVPSRTASDYDTVLTSF